MCIMIAKKMGVPVPSDETMDNCFRMNRDGCGVAWTEGLGVVHIKKDFKDHDEFKNWVHTHLSTEDQSAILHYRLATSGLEDCGNRHPFPITENKIEMRKVEMDTDIAVAHNGVFRGLGDKKFSDTMEFVSEILAKPEIRNNLHSKALQALILAYIDTSKLLFLHGDGGIWSYGKFEEDENKILYSNYQYKSYMKYEVQGDFDYYGRKKTGWEPGKVWDYATNSWRDKGAITVLRNCIQCKASFVEDKTLELYDEVTKDKVPGVMCRRCFYKDGGNKWYVLYDEKKHGNDSSLNRALKEIQKLEGNK